MSGVDAVQRAQQFLKFDMFTQSRNLTQGEIAMSHDVLETKLIVICRELLVCHGLRIIEL